MINAVLGDLRGKVYVDEHSSRELMFVRIRVRLRTTDLLKTVVVIVKNEGIAPAVYGLPVNILDGKVVSVCKQSPVVEYR